MTAAIIRWSLRHRILVLAASLLLALWGARATQTTPLDAIPDLSDVQVIIKTTYPGQAPQLVEDQVTYPLSAAMLSVPGATTVRGYSFFNDSYVYVLFEEDTDLYWARSRVLEALSQVSGELPAAARSALGPDATGVGWVYQYALVDRSRERDLGDLRSLQDWFLRYELESLPGVAEVAAVGGMQREYQVIADPIALRAHALTLADLRRAIRAGNRESGARVLEMAEAEYMLRATGYARTTAELAAIPVTTDADGTPILVGDIAQVRTGPALRRGIGELNGEGEAVGGIIVMRHGQNPLTTIEGVKARLETLRESLPPGVEIVETYNRAGLIERAVDALGRILIEEFLIVALVCGLFLFHLRASLVVILSLPLGILMAFIAMQLQGLTLNIMSLGGIAIAVGAMVDATVVMLENAYRHLQARGARDARAHWEAVTEAAVEVGPALFFSLLIIALSFIPIFALQGEEGRLFAPLAWTKTWAMLAAAILAITLVPVLIGFLLRGRLSARVTPPLSRAMDRLYRPALEAVLRTPYLTVAMALLLTLSALFPLTRLGSEFMPDLNEGDLLYMPSAFPAASAATMASVLGQTNRLILQTPEVESAYAKAGRADSATDPAPLSMIETHIQLKPREDWRPGITLDDIRDELDARVQIPGLTNTWLMPIRSRLDMLSTGIRTPVGIKLAGDDLEVLNTVATRIETLIAELPGTTSVYAERVTAGRYLTLDVDRAAAARHGMNIDDVHEALALSVGGAVISEVLSGRERYGISLRYPREWRDSVSRLAALPLHTPTGGYIALGEIADIRVEDGPGVIRSENARLNAWIHIDTDTRNVADFVDRAKSALDEGIELPRGVSLSWSGQFESLQRASERLAVVVPSVLLIIALLLYLTFQRAAPVVMVLASLPLAIAAGSWLLYLLDYRQSVATGVGFIALGGVAVEIAILMLLYLQQAHDRLLTDNALPTRAALRQAVIDGAMTRIRPIMMTATSTVAGLLPIMLGSGTGAEVTRRIAAPMIGGMLGISLLALLVLPAVYYLWQERHLQRGVDD
jgi:Cu(I)/Ag(I) efflux system membrane protein CusA/SilA